jgi:5-formyltetrahydrofolate cyclo-ligase
MDKTELRRWAKTTRADLPDDSAQVSAHLAEFLRKKSRQTLLYSAFGSEIDPSELFSLHPAQYYLPRIDREYLSVHLLPCEMVRHPYGFWEPAPSSQPVDPACLEAVLVPGLAFDARGHRLGYGQGYYDRFLGQLKPTTLTIGVVAEPLIIAELPTDLWDIPVQYLATEWGVWPAKAQQDTTEQD